MESFLNIAASVTTIVLGVVALTRWLGARASINFLMAALCIALVVLNLVDPPSPSGSMGPRWVYTLSGISMSFAGIGAVNFLISGIKVVWRNRQMDPKRGPQG